MAQHGAAMQCQMDRRRLIIAFEEIAGTGQLAVKRKWRQRFALQGQHRLQHAMAQHVFGVWLMALLQELQTLLALLLQLAQTGAKGKAVHRAQQHAITGRQRVDAFLTPVQPLVEIGQGVFQWLAPMLVERPEILVDGEAEIFVVALLRQGQRQPAHLVTLRIGLAHCRHRRNVGYIGNTAHIALAVLQRGLQQAAGIHHEGAELPGLVSGIR